MLSPGVYVGPEAVVLDSILFTDCSVEAGARVQRSIVDKYVTVGHRAQVGRFDPAAKDLGITAIGKNVQIPNNTIIGRGAQVGADILPDAFPHEGVADGQILERKA